MPAAILLLLTATACAGTATRPDPERQARLDRARELLAQDDPYGALDLTDQLLEADPDDFDARRLAASGNLALVEKDPNNAAGFLADGIRNLERAVELRPKDPEVRLQLARALLQDGRFEAGRDAALEAAKLLQAQGASIARLAVPVLVAADNEMQMFVDARRAELQQQQEELAGEPATGAQPQPSAETLTLANQVLSRLAYARQGAPAEASQKAAAVYQWLNRPTTAIEELQRGIAAAPEATALHDAYLALHTSLGRTAECAAAYRRMLRDGGAPVLHWFLGRALVGAGDAHRAASRFPDAIAAYEQAAAEFAQYGAMAPQHSAGVRRWLAITALSVGRCQFESGDLEAANGSYLRAYEQDPACADYDADGQPAVFDSFGGNYLGGLYLIGRAIADRVDREQALTDSLRHYEAVLARHPDRFGTIYNNAGLSARDLGNLLEAKAKPDGTAEAARRALLDQALALYERSYAHYEKAVRLEPDDARIVNDCGLMLIYHLHRDYDRARALFEQAIAVGQPKLDALADDAPVEERQQLEEAVGDAWQNLAVMARAQGKPFAEYRDALERAVRYFPYQRRQAAAMLRAGASGGPAEAVATQDPERAAKLTRVVAAAQPKADAGDFDGALQALDAAKAELRGHAPWHALVGRWSLQYARQAIADGGSAAQIEGLIVDAVANLRRAVELDSEPPEPRRWLAEALLQSGDAPAAHRAAEELLSHLRSRGDADPAIGIATHRVRAGAAARAYIEQKGAGQSDDDALRAARASFRELETRQQLDDEMRGTWIALEQWAGAPDQALEIVGRALERSPERSDLLAQLVDLGTGPRAQKVVDALASRSDALGLWYLGRARFNLALDRWSANPADPKEALATLDQAAAGFDAAMQKEASYAKSSTEWKALALGAKGVLHLGAGDLERAEQELLAAAQLAPAQATTDLGTGQTVKSALVILVDKHYRKPDLDRAIRLLQQIVAALPADTDFLNNLGLFARDHGVALERGGDAAAAKRMFEISYDAYAKASALEPDSIRLINDRALLLIYHLHRDLETAAGWLRDAAVSGQRRLDENPPEDGAARQDLEESVGDCHQNLGYYLMTHAKDYPAARRELERSLEYHPREQRASRGLLRQLERLERDK